jgi:hypothetical protein
MRRSVESRLLAIAAACDDSSRNSSFQFRALLVPQLSYHLVHGVHLRVRVMVNATAASAARCRRRCRYTGTAAT